MKTNKEIKTPEPWQSRIPFGTAYGSEAHIRAMKEELADYETLVAELRAAFEAQTAAPVDLSKLKGKAPENWDWNRQDEIVWEQGYNEAIRDVRALLAAKPAE
jgi:hypothetical protein